MVPALACVVPAPRWIFFQSHQWILWCGCSMSLSWVISNSNANKSSARRDKLKFSRGSMVPLETCSWCSWNSWWLLLHLEMLLKCAWNSWNSWCSWNSWNSTNRFYLQTNQNGFKIRAGALTRALQRTSSNHSWNMLLKLLKHFWNTWWLLLSLEMLLKCA